MTNECSHESDHDRVAGSGAWLGAIVFMAVFGWLDTKMPALAAWALNWAAILGVCYAMAAWKRAWYAWLAFWGMAVICPVSGICELAGLTSSMSSTVVWLISAAMVFAWYWLIRIPRLQPAVQALERAEVHVIHHVIHHGLELPGWSGTGIAGGTAAPLPAPARKVIAGGVVRAIEPALRARASIKARTGKPRAGYPREPA